MMQKKYIKRLWQRFERYRDIGIERQSNIEVIIETDWAYLYILATAYSPGKNIIAQAIKVILPTKSISLLFRHSEAKVCGYNRCLLFIFIVCSNIIKKRE